MNNFRLRSLACIGLSFAIASWAIAQPGQRPYKNPIEVKTGQEVLPADTKAAGDRAKPGPITTPPSIFPTGAQGDLLRTHMKLMTGVGTDPEQQYQDAEKAYQNSLRELRGSAIKITPLLADAYSRAEERDYFQRWALIETMRELQSEATVSILSKIATSSIPPERVRDDPERSSVDEELRIRVTAVEALGPLSKTNAIATRTLLSLTKSPYLGIKRSAIRGYLAAASSPKEQRKRAEKLKASLPKNQYRLITLETTDVKKVPHPEMPEKFEIKKSRPPEGAPPKIPQTK